jgi:hypothetical protein
MGQGANDEDGLHHLVSLLAVDSKSFGDEGSEFLHQGRHGISPVYEYHANI